MNYKLLEDPAGIEISDWEIVCNRGSSIMASSGVERDSRLSEELGMFLPDMIFEKNFIKLKYNPTNFTVLFDPLDALRLVNKSEVTIKVSHAVNWASKNIGANVLNKCALKPYDWTFTTSYRGNLFPATTMPLLIETTEESINLEVLKIPEQIIYYDEVPLFEDELDDNGISSLSVKIRVMPSGFFLLQQFHLRVDGVIFRIFETRLYHSFGSNYIHREYTEKEEKYSTTSSKISQDISAQVLQDPLIFKNSTWLSNSLPTCYSCKEKIYIC